MCLFSARNSLVMVAALLLQVSPKAEGVALLPFKKLQSSGFSLRVAGHGCKAVPQEGTSCSGLAALARMFLCPPVSCFFPMDSEQSSASAAFSRHFTQVLKNPKVAAEF